MPTLSSLLVQRGVASMQAVEEAISRQVLHGGDLATNILDLGAVAEPVLTALLAESLGLDPAMGRLRPANPEALRVVPSELAQRHGVFPLDLVPGAGALAVETLVIATSESLAPAVEDDLSFALGVALRPCAAPLVRIHQAQAEHYGVPLERRYQRLVGRLDARGAGQPEVAPVAPVAPVAAPAPPAIEPAPPPDLPVAASDSDDAPSPSVERDIPTLPRAAPGPGALTGWLQRAAGESRHDTLPNMEVPEHVIPPAPPRAIEPLPVRAPSAPDEGARDVARPRRKGPFTVAMAEDELGAASSTDAVIEIVFAFGQQYFEYTALFIVQGDAAIGRTGSGPGAVREQLAAIRVPLDRPCLFAAARERCAPIVAPLAAEGVDAALLRDLGRLRWAGIAAATIPIAVRNRVVALLYGDDGADPVELSTIGEVIAVAALAAPALERLILRKKLGRRAGPASTPKRAAPPERVIEPPQRFVAPPEQEAAPPEQEAAPPEQEAAPPEQAPPQPEQAAAPVEARHAEASSHDQGPLSSRTRAALLELSAMSGAGGDPPPPAPQARPPTQSETIDVLARAFGLRGTGLEVDERPEPAGVGPGVDGRVRKVSPTAPTEEMPAVRDVAIPDLVIPAPGRAPSSTSSGERRDAVAARAAGESRGYAALVQQVVDGSDGAATAFAELVRSGESAMKSIAALFPGPIRVDRRTREHVSGSDSAGADGRSARPPVLPPASQCGPILDLIVAIQRPALPFMTVRSASPDPEVRFWATHVLGELRFKEAANALLPRLFDDDVAVRKIARRASAALVNDAGSDEGAPSDAGPAVGTPIVKGLEYLVRDRAESITRRILAIETMGEIRAASFVPSLIVALADPHEIIAESAARALTVIARDDFGRDARAWSVWWAANAERHRIEWLIDALTHEQGSIRRAAGDELKAITKEYFGYYDDLPRRERERAQARYQAWWTSDGRFKFRMPAR